MSQNVLIKYDRFQEIRTSSARKALRGTKCARTSLVCYLPEGLFKALCTKSTNVTTLLMIFEKA